MDTNFAFDFGGVLFILILFVKNRGLGRGYA